MKFGRGAFLNLAAVAGALLVFSSAREHKSTPVDPSRSLSRSLPAGRQIRSPGLSPRGCARRLVNRLLSKTLEGPTHIAVGRAARAAPDGYTISIGNVATHVLNGAAYPLSYDLLNDFESISLLTNAPAFIDARNTLPPKEPEGIDRLAQVQS